jgi:hypothetical protein
MKQTKCNICGRIVDLDMQKDNVCIWCRQDSKYTEPEMHKIDPANIEVNKHNGNVDVTVKEESSTSGCGCGCITLPFILLGIIISVWIVFHIPQIWAFLSKLIQ